MGCDIHLAVEVRREGKWERVMPPESARDPEYVKLAKGSSDSFYGKWAVREWYHDRNYRVFAVLADVRNDGNVVPIADARGLPGDLSDACKRLDYEHADHDEDDISLGDHSQSWLTLAELQAYPWDGEAEQQGVVSLQEFMERVVAQGTALPVVVEKYPYKSWSGDIMGRNIVVRRASEVLAAIANGGLAAGIDERTYVRDTWKMAVRVNAGSFTTRLMPELAKLGAPDDVRIVFGFDS